jgi:hypothetical protein
MEVRIRIYLFNDMYFKQKSLLKKETLSTYNDAL